MTCNLAAFTFNLSTLQPLNLSTFQPTPGPYNGSFHDFKTNVVNLRAIVAQLRSTHPAATPLLDANRGYVRFRVPGDSPLRTMCLIEHIGPKVKHDVNGSTLDKDAWGDDLCNYNKDITFGLRTGPRGLLIGFAVGHLGLHVNVNGTLLLHRLPVAAHAATMEVSLPDEVAERWPAELKGVRLGGVRVGANCVDIACNMTSTRRASSSSSSSSNTVVMVDPKPFLRCEFEWSVRGALPSVLVVSSD